MAGNQTNNIQILDASSPFMLRSIEATDNLIIGATLQIQNDTTIQGNLVVDGTLTALETDSLRTKDRHILLNDGYTTAAGQTCGLVANYLPTATADTVNGAFTAGVGGVSNPTVVTTGAATFSTSDIILITNAANEVNNGIFEVLSHAANVLTIRGIGLTSTVEDWTQNQFETDATVQGNITKVNASVIRSGTDGNWEVAKGSTTPFAFVDLGTSGAVDLQGAYDNTVGSPATITTNVTHGAVLIAGNQKLQVTATGGLDVDTLADFDVTTFDVQMTGTNGFSIDGTAASNVTVTGGNLTLSTVTSGNVLVQSVGNVDVDGASLTLNGTAASNFTVDSANLTLSTTTSGNVVVNATGDVDVDGTNIDLLASSGFSIDGGAASNVSVTSANLTLSTITSGDVIVNAASNVNVDGTSVQIDGTAASNFTVDDANLTLSTTTAGDVIVNASGDVDVDGSNIDLLATAAFSIDGSVASNVTVDGANLTLSTTTSGDVIVNAAGNVNVDGTSVQIDGTAASNFTVDDANLTLSTTTSGNVVINATSNVDVDGTNIDLLASSAFSIDGSAASNVSVTSANLTLSTITAGNVVVSSAGNVDVDGAAITLDGTAASNFTVTGANLTLSTLSTGNILVQSAGNVDVDGVSVTINGTAASNFTVDSANLTLSTTTSGDVIVNATSNVDVDGTNIDLLASSGFSIDGGAASNVSVTSANLTLSTITGGQLILTSAGDMDITVPAASGTAMTLDDGAVTYINVDSTTKALDLDQHVNLVEGAGIELTTDVILAQGDIVNIKANGNLQLADANSTFQDGLVAGISRGTFGAASTAQIFTVSGSLIPIRFTAAPAAANNGDPVFLSSTAGQATLTAPSGSGTTVYLLGYLQGADGADTTPLVLYAPQYISRTP